MAVDVFGLTYTDLEEYVPIPVSLLTASDFITPDMITSWIEKGGARVAGLLTKAGIDPTTLDDNSTAIVQEAVLLNAALATMNRVGQTGEQRTDLKTRRDEAERRIAAQASTLPSRPTTITSNVPDADSVRALQFGVNSGW